MEINASSSSSSSSSQEKNYRFFAKIKNNFLDFPKKMKKLGKDDPRRIFHSIKVGLALTIVSLFYYFRPLYDGFGPSAMWAILTVVVVFEFTVGGTLCKCLNRGMATLLAGALGVGAAYLGTLGGKKGEPIILGVLVFLLAGASTFTRFIPQIKRRYDYGVTIFILTFSLVAVSGYRVDQIVELAHQRLSTILIGAFTCMIISIFLCPVWAGEDLHNKTITNIEKLAKFFEGIGEELFNFAYEDDDIKENCSGVNGEVKDEDKSFLQDIKSVINSKANEESLANLAWWEPCHGRFRFCHPWKQYLKIGEGIRQCAYHMDALANYIKRHPQEPTEVERKIQKPCTKMTSEAGKALKEIASAIKKMTQPSDAVKVHLRNMKSATEELKTVLETTSLQEATQTTTITEIVQAVTLASLLIQIINCVENISKAVDELSDQARFLKKKKKTSSSSETQQQQKSQQQLRLHRGIVKPVNDFDGGDVDHVVINIGGILSTAQEINGESKGGQNHVGPAG